MLRNNELDSSFLPVALILQAALEERAGHDAAASRLLSECPAMRRRVGHKFGIALRHHCYDDAEQYYKESLSVAWEAKEIFVLAPSLEGLSAAALAKKSPERAARLWVPPNSCAARWACRRPY